MADEQSKESVDSANDDPLKNLKSEFSRKFENIKTMNESLIAQNEQLSAKLDQVITSSMKSTQRESEVDYEDLKYTDPDKYVELKVKEVEGRVDQRINESLAQQNAKAQTLQELAADYPEINDQASPLYKKALELGGRYEKNFVGTPEGIRLVVREAASQLGLLPSAVRAQMVSSGGDSMDDFIAGPNSGGNRRQEQKKKDELDPKTLETAKLMGLDVENKEVIERLKKYSKRKWNKWE